MSDSNYPPGVSGREPQITGEWRCENCGTVLPEGCEGDACPDGCIEPDPDEERDRQLDRELNDPHPWRD